MNREYYESNYIYNIIYAYGDYIHISTFDQTNYPGALMYAIPTPTGPYAAYSSG